MLVEVLAVVIGLGKYLNYLDRKKWDATRVRLAQVLLSSMAKNSNNSVNLLVDEVEEKYLVVNDEFERFLLNLQHGLSNFNEQTIVHLPAFLPPNSEKLSELSSKISSIEESAINLMYYYKKIKDEFQFFDKNNPQEKVVESNSFYVESRDIEIKLVNENGTVNKTLVCSKLMHLAEKADKNARNYFVMSLHQLFGRMEDLWHAINMYVCDRNACLVFKNGPEKLSVGYIKDSRVNVDKLANYRKLIEQNCFHLVHYTPTDVTLS